MNILVATHNSGKMREYRALLASFAGQLRFPPDLNIQVTVQESGATYAENAWLKARAFAQAAGSRRNAPESLIVLADDSGLEVDALDGAPGIRSARYTLGSDADRLTALLAHLKGIPTEQRTARFRCVLAILPSQGPHSTVEGVCEGIIATRPSGEGGFGYDPIFYLPEFGCTMAQLLADVKNRVSHRARAVQAAMPAIERLLAEAGNGV